MTNKEAIEILDAFRFTDDALRKVFYKVDKAIDIAIKALNDRPTGEWIPVSERLPEEKINPITNDFEDVLCTTIFGDVRAYGYGKPIGHKEAHFWNMFDIMDKYVVAWMPLPKPYKDAEE